MSQIRRWLLHEYLLVFLFCFAAITGPAFSLMDNFDQSQCVDCKTYLGLAEGHWNQSPVRRYRPIVPALATVANKTFGRLFHLLQPTSFPGDFSLSFSFFLVNSLLLSLWGLVIYLFIRSYQVSRVWALAGLLVLFTCRWTPYIAGTPIADSLYCLVVGAALLSLRQQSKWLTAAVIIVGPFAKEAFIFIAPLLFFFAPMPKKWQLVWFTISGILVFGYRYVFDRLTGLPAEAGLAADVEHISYMAENARRLIGFHGLYDVLSNEGLWLVFPIIAFTWVPIYRTELKQVMQPVILWFLLSILVHMVLSSSFERMFYLTMPLLCLITAMSFRILGNEFAPKGK